MKNIFILFSVLLFSSRIQGQINFCASNEIHNQKMIIDSNYQQKYLQAHTIMQQANNNNALMVGDVYYLPVIVHVIHTGDPLGTGSNPSDLQIQNYISVLNQAFSASFPTYPDTNNGGQNIKIQFQLAQRDLNCNATNGINRINASNNANYVSDGVKWNWNDPGISHNDLATIAFWDNTQYINLWLVNNIYGWTAGYAYYPVAGYSFGDGIVIESGDVYSNNPYLVAHEFGHAFDLRHTHEGSSGAICPPNNICLNEGDYVCDTDPTLENINNFGCSAANINPCTNASYGNIIYNYMNYYCYHTMFTLGQKQRMINALLNLKSSLISSLGAQAPSPITPTISIVESFNNICSGTSVTYTASITNGGTPSYQWKVNGNNVGTNTNTYSYTPNNTDIVTCQLTSTATCANPTIVNSNSINMFVTNIVTPTISIVESANNICSGTSVSYTASITNGGTPTYQWKVNGTNVGTNTNTYSYIPNNTDIVTCQLTSTATCANPTIVNSNSINMIVSNVVSPTISIVESANNICLGTMVTYTATITNGGTPTYQWKVNGNNVGTNSNIYSYIPNNTDIVTCQLTSTAACINPIIVTSNSINMIVFNAVTPTISIIESANNICQGTSVTYTASITNGGTPSYQWIVNGTNVGTNSNTYTYIPNNVDIVACQLTSTATCANPIIVTSNSINMYVTNAVTPTISIVESANNICQGTSVTYTASITNGGTPTYQWKVNGNNVGTNTNTFSYIPNNADIVTCQLTSTATCANPTIVTSNSLSMIVTNVVSPTISIVESANNICQGTSVTYTASITNGGTPTYQWKVNGNNVGTNTNTFTYIPNNGDIVTCQLTSTAACANPTIVNSNSINMIVFNAVTPTISIVESANNICQGTSVTYTASITNGGTPSYQWIVNGTNVGTNSNTYTYIPNNVDIVACQLTSTANCAYPVNVTSNLIIMYVNMVNVPSVTINQIDTNICEGSAIACLASYSNAGNNPVKRWIVNGDTIPNSNINPYYHNNSQLGDTIICEITSNDPCSNPNIIYSLPVFAQVKTIDSPIVVSFGTYFKVLNYDFSTCNCNISWYHINSATTFPQNDTIFNPPWYGSYICYVLYDFCSSSSIDTLNFYPTPLVNINNNNQLTVYPNPSTSGLFGIIYNSEIVKYDIYSLDGRLIHNGFKKKEIDLNNFSKGVYFLKIETTDGAFVRKITFQ